MVLSDYNTNSVICHMRQIAQRDDIRDLILDGVDSLLSRYGYRKMTMDDLAAAVGIGKGTIYLHFSSKEEVALSHIDRIIERLCDELELLARAKEPVDLRIRKMLQLRVLFRFDSVQHYTQSLNDLLSALRPSFLARRQNHFEQEAEIFVRVLEEGRRENTFQFHNSRVTARTLLMATNSLLPYSLNARELGERSFLSDQAARIAELLLSGLRSRRKKGGK